MKSAYTRVENMIGKGENINYQNFSVFHDIFISLHKKLQYLSHIHFVICNCFQFGVGLRFYHLGKS